MPLGESLMTMPLHVLRNIISYLEVFDPAGGLTNDSISNLKNVTVINKFFRDLTTESLWKSIVFSFDSGVATQLKTLLDKQYARLPHFADHEE